MVYIILAIVVLMCLTATVSYGSQEKCPHCGMRGMDRSGHCSHGYYSRGYNEWCEQAAGDWGIYCWTHKRVYFKTSDEEYLNTLPNWCTYHGVPGRGLPPKRKQKG